MLKGDLSGCLGHEVDLGQASALQGTERLQHAFIRHATVATQAHHGLGLPCGYLLGLGFESRVLDGLAIPINVALCIDVQTDGVAGRWWCCTARAW